MARARRRAGQGGCAPPSSTPSTSISRTAANIRRTRARSRWQDVEDCLVLVSNSFSTQTSYENQTKKSITNKFVQEAMTDFSASPAWRPTSSRTRVEALKIAEQVLINKRSRESGGKAAAEHQEKALRQYRHFQPRAEVRGLPHARRCPAAKFISLRATALWAASSSRATRSFRASCPCAARS